MLTMWMCTQNEYKHHLRAITDAQWCVSNLTLRTEFKISFVKVPQNKKCGIIKIEQKSIPSRFWNRYYKSTIVGDLRESGQQTCRVTNER
jgi:hypothetical protein